MFPNATIWTVSKITPSRLTEVDRRVNIIVANRKKYEQLEQLTGVPWFVTGCIHSLEADFNFNTILANGDPLGEPTKHIPRGLVAHTWVDGGVISYTHQGWMHLPGWDLLANVLDRLEAYNGMGYRLVHNVPSAYLYSFTNVYKCGKYTSDGAWSPTAVSQQCGAVAILLRMVQRNILTQNGDKLMTTPMVMVPANSSAVNTSNVSILATMVTMLTNVALGPGSSLAILLHGQSWWHYVAAAITTATGLAGAVLPVLALVNSNAASIVNTVSVAATQVVHNVDTAVPATPTPAPHPAS